MPFLSQAIRKISLLPRVIRSRVLNGKNKAGSFFFKPLQWCAAAGAAAVYVGVIPVSPEKPFTSLLLCQQITRISGVISSNPVKNSSESTWTVCVDTEEVSNHTVCSSSRGRVSIIIPSSVAEAHYPGKMYAGSGAVLETGAAVDFQVRLLDGQNEKRPLFYADSLVQRGWKNTAAKLRAFSRMQFKRLMHVWGSSGGLFLALMCGAREYTDKHLADSFMRAGLAHILALSGMHLSFFAGAASKTAKFSGGVRSAPFLSLCAVCIFVWFAGFSPSLYRAFISSLCTMFFSAGSVKVKPLEMLSLSFIIQTCVHPSDSVAASFLLSYGALLGMGSVGSVIEKLACRILPPAVSKNISSSIGAQLCTAPVCISMFGCIMPVGIVAGIIIGPLVSVFMICGCISTVLSLCMPFLLVPLGDIMHLLYTVIDAAVSFFSAVPPLTFIL